MRNVRQLLTRLLLLSTLQSFAVSAIDLQPNDIVAPLPGKNYLMLSYLNTENNTFYKNGSVFSAGPYKNPVIDANTAILRGTTTYSIADLPAVSYLQMPYGSVKLGGSLSSQPTDTGLGDITIATAIWPYADRASRTYLGVAGYLITPTGSYSNQRLLSVGENRFKSDLQIGFQKPITDSIDGMVAVDTMWYGGNGQCSAACQSATMTSFSQKPLTTVQIGPIYNINPIFTVGASYFYVAGGATSLNNVYQNNVVNTQRFLLSGLAHTPIGRFSLQYGRDMEVKNGFAQSRLLAIRFAKEF